MALLDFRGHRILVTGASSGIGRATAQLLARVGASVILNGRDEARLASAWESLVGVGHAVEPFDLMQCEAIPGWLARLASTYGPLDGVVCSAGAYLLAPLRVVTAEQASEIFRLNVLASLWVAKGLQQPGVSAPGCSIVFVSSVAGLSGQTALSVYSASKSALVALARPLAIELAPAGIRINCVAPGNLRVGMAGASRSVVAAIDQREMEKEYPLGFGDPEDVAQAIVFLLSPAARWITGTTLVVDGGFAAH